MEVTRYRVNKKCGGESDTLGSDMGKRACKQACCESEHCNFVSFKDGSCISFLTCNEMSDDPGCVVFYKPEVPSENPTPAHTTAEPASAPEEGITEMQQYMENKVCSGRPEEMWVGVSEDVCVEKCLSSDSCQYVNFDKRGKCEAFVTCDTVWKSRVWGVILHKVVVPAGHGGS